MSYKLLFEVSDGKSEVGLLTDANTMILSINGNPEKSVQYICLSNDIVSALKGTPNPLCHYGVSKNSSGGIDIFFGFHNVKTHLSNEETNRFLQEYGLSSIEVEGLMKNN